MFGKEYVIQKKGAILITLIILIIGTILYFSGSAAKNSEMDRVINTNNVDSSDSITTKTATTTETAPILLDGAILSVIPAHRFIEGTL
jgi:hypothetical protein